MFVLLCVFRGDLTPPKTWSERSVRPAVQRAHTFGSWIMDKERIAGGVKKATGTVKKAVGKATGDRRLEAEGRADKAEGRVRSAVGHAKDAVREITGKR